ncbi:hypothetical protein ABPG74_000680 [Tetrahymena malaccensis]
MDNQIYNEDQNIFDDSNYLRDEQAYYPPSYYQYQQSPYQYSEQSFSNAQQQVQTPQYTVKHDTLSIQNNQTGSSFYVNLIQRQHSSFSLKNNNYNNINNNYSAKNFTNNKTNIVNNTFNGNQQTNFKNFQMGISEGFCSPNSKSFGLRNQGEDYQLMNDPNQGGLGFNSGIQQTMLHDIGSNQNDTNQNCLFENKQEQYKEITQIQGIKQNQVAEEKIENQLKIKGELIDSLQKSHEIKIKRMEKKKQKQLAFQQKISSYPKRVLRSQTVQNTPVKMQDSTQIATLSINDPDQTQKNRYFQESNQPSITQIQETHQQIKENFNQEISQQNSYRNDDPNFLYFDQTQIGEDIPQNMVTANYFAIPPSQNNYYYTQNSQQLQTNLSTQNQSIFFQNQLKMGENSSINPISLVQPIQNSSDINQQQHSLRSSQVISQIEDDLHLDRNEQEYFEAEDNKDDYTQIYTSNQKEYADNDGVSSLTIIPDLKGLLSSINTIQKKNVVKNLMTSFKRFIVSLFEKESHSSKKNNKDYLFKKYSINIYFDSNKEQNPEVLSQIRSQILSFYYDYQKQEKQIDEQKFLKKYKRYLDNKLFNHYTLSLLLKHQQYAPIFKYYLENFVSNWLINSKVNDRISHQLMVEFLLKSYNSPQLVQQLEHNQYKQKEVGL